MDKIAKYHREINELKKELKCHLSKQMRIVIADRIKELRRKIKQHQRENQ